MRPIVALSFAFALSSFAFAAPAALAGSCNIVYDTSPYLCVSLDPGTQNEPGLCASSPPSHCGSPCVLNECVTQQATPVECLSVETDSLATVPICVPFCTPCIQPEADILP